MSSSPFWDGSTRNELPTLQQIELANTTAIKRVLGGLPTLQEIAIVSEFTTLSFVELGISELNQRLCSVMTGISGGTYGEFECNDFNLGAHLFSGEFSEGNQAAFTQKAGRRRRKFSNWQDENGRILIRIKNGGSTWLKDDAGYYKLAANGKKIPVKQPSIYDLTPLFEFMCSIQSNLGNLSSLSSRQVKERLSKSILSSFRKLPPSSPIKSKTIEEQRVLLVSRIKSTKTSLKSIAKTCDKLGGNGDELLGEIEEYIEILRKEQTNAGSSRWDGLTTKKPST